MYFRYEFKIDGVSAGNSGSSGASSAISDTGTSYIVGPEDAVAKIAEELGATSDFFGQRVNSIISINYLID